MSRLSESQEWLSAPTMRLSKIKLAGFKSFVDPTTFDFRSNLTSIVGPNGCGKSNTIDAVRWVMGESSAKHLRGASMEDVIFNGSTSRKKIGQAWVELVFDNSDGSLGGEYAQYSEISTKRLISRDGKSQYFLNGTRCRRKDITDIFLGTGLGPRSYAIIEQGMISRLIDAKPEELRVYIEEAAGISKYKERRRETENRIRATKDNLERLDDLREEVDKQLGTLKRQASAAERYKDFRDTERRLQAELLFLQLQAIDQELEIQQAQITEEAAEHTEHFKEQRAIEADLEALRTKQTEANAHFNQVQAGVYEAGSEVSQLQQQIKHQHEIVERDKLQREHLNQELLSARTHLQHDELRLSDALASLEILEPQAEEVLEVRETQQEALDTAEDALNNWKQQWAQAQQQLAEPTRQLSVESSRTEQLQQQISRNQQRLQRLEQQQSEQTDDANADEEIEALNEQQALLSEQLQEAELILEEVKEQALAQQTSQREQQQQQDQLRSTLQRAKGRLSSLETLQQADLGKDKKSLNRWLSDQKLDNLPRLAEQIKVAPKWEKAVEVILGPTLEALQLPDKQKLESIISNGCTQALELLIPNTSQNEFSADSLAHQVIAPETLKPLLANIICVKDHKEALVMQRNLSFGERLITPNGDCYAANWVSFSGSKDNKEGGVLARKKEIDALKEQIDLDEAALLETEQQLVMLQEARKQLTDKQQQQQQQQQQLHRSESETNAQLHSLKQRQEQQLQFAARTSEEVAELKEQQEQDAEQLTTSEETQELAQAQIEQLNESLEQLREQQHSLEQAVSHCRVTLQSSRDQHQGLQIQIETQRNNSQNSQQQLTRITDQIETLQARQLSQTESQLDDKLIASLQEQLDLTIAKREEIEEELMEARQMLSDIDQNIRDQELARGKAEAKVNTLREKIETLKLSWQSVNVRRETLVEQQNEIDYEVESFQQEMELEKHIKAHQEELISIKQKIQRLGAINLAAIEEFSAQNERKVYLDDQHADLTKAMDTLEAAIRKIDRDTRGRFKDTFEKVNERIQDMFPRLFGGGKAYLEMTGDDLLTTGVSIMARPPGKNLSSIQLMSGGEKALTAAAMVFAIFELNPAPFCMLDEVDAPLDEANVGRFCKLVKHMSERVQFIFITHNKTTMELAENLIGVTMREPGVSRMVSVDVDEAAKMIKE